MSDEYIEIFDIASDPKLQTKRTREEQEVILYNMVKEVQKSLPDIKIVFKE